jgi:hypothetical protein
MDKLQPAGLFMFAFVDSGASIMADWCELFQQL